MNYDQRQAVQRRLSLAFRVELVLPSPLRIIPREITPKDEATLRRRVHGVLACERITGRMLTRR